MTDWTGKTVVILGLARQGKALARYFSQQDADVVVSDIRPKVELEEEQLELVDLHLHYVFEEHPPSLLEKADLLCLSGGVPADIPLALQAIEAGIPVTNDAQIFLDLCAAQIIGITGSAGKTTTTSLVAHIAQHALEGSGRTVWLGGNIGVPLLDHVGEITRSDVVVMELSSFQLEIMTSAPPIGALLNLTPDHLDRHRTMDAYMAAKARLLENQVKPSVMVLNREDAMVWGMRDRVVDTLLSFGRDLPDEGEGSYISKDQIHVRFCGHDQVVCAIDQIPLPGDHNLANVLAASILVASAGLPLESIEPALVEFRGIPHRLEFVRSFEGVDWYNDSIATTPDRALSAVHSFSRPIILIAGGRDKDLDWEGFALGVLQAVQHLILFGEAAEIIEAAINEVLTEGDQINIYRYERMEKALIQARDIAKAGDVVVLSPGGTSFDEFPNYEARGDVFKEFVRSM